jgi:hypothetical protein
MNPFLNLSEDNTSQVLKYLKFFRQKKEAILRAVTHEFNDVKNDRLTSEVFTREDFEEFTEYLENSIQVHSQITYKYVN